MMAQLSYAPLFLPVSVIGSEFIPPYQYFNIIVYKYSSGNLLITDTNHKILLKVKPCDTSLHYQRVLLDVHDKPIVMIRNKIMGLHHRWDVFKGDSKSKSDMIFSTKAPDIFCSKSIHVFLANKASNKDVCDYKIKGRWSERDCTISMGDTSITIAQMYDMPSSENTKFASDKFMVTIYPDVDCAFIVTLIAILDAMKTSATKNKERAAGGVLGLVGSVITSVLF